MTRQRLSKTNDSAHGTTRRSFLTGLGGLGLIGIGTTVGRTSATTDSRANDLQQHIDPFADPGELEAFVDEVMAERVGTTTPGATVVIVSGDSLSSPKDMALLTSIPTIRFELMRQCSGLDRSGNS